MRIGTSNKLAHYQCEYRELTEQTSLLQGQVAPLSASLAQLQSYLSVNGGDRNAVTQFKTTQRRLHSINSQINRNMIRLARLERQINEENMRLLSRINSMPYYSPRPRRRYY